MSKETNLRYEQPHNPSKLYQEYTKNLQANDQLLINDIDQKVLDQRELHDKWFEKSNLKVKAKAYQLGKKQLEQEMKMVAKANLLVRQRALALRIEADQKMYEEELAQMGKTFHKQRV
ncbi:uncharacterized protein LOC101862098 [Aplysia californica]|uniref:Uncharacterized protein LOC101862098 n=1 Tax=Aplysia californica TaxID=6500 RepID=A0ABM0JFB3_APLCA|nr:uncharacterized protein LOC101862098 [Aplysia californica]